MVKLKELGGGRGISPNQSARWRWDELIESVLVVVAVLTAIGWVVVLVRSLG